MKFTEKDPDFLGLGLSRHWEGALMGVLAVFIASLLCWGAGFSPFTIVFFAVSSVLPAALIGSLLISKKMIQRSFGVILLAAYIILWIFLLFFLLGTLAA